ncbi:MAG: GtrA family protein [Treponema sp.]|jgi:putative flippase GtrA|nr:GtrA family protein [Treponema sp.]
MLKKYILRHKQLLHEFFRYVFVGGIAFIVDFGVLYLSKTLFFSTWDHTGILIAAALGFTSGLVFNYIFCLLFVFRQIDENARHRKIRSFILFVIIGIIGLLITELCMYAGVYLFGQKWYLIVKIFTAGIVLMWNYAGRKVLIFKGAGYVQE